MEARLPGEARGGVAVLERDVDRLRRHRLGEARLRELLVVEQVAHLLFGRHQEDVGRLHAGRLMPAGLTSTIDLMRAVLRTAISSAIQPPIELPTSSTSFRSSCSQEIQVEVGHVVDVLEPLGLVRQAVARMLGHQHVEALAPACP